MSIEERLNAIEATTPTVRHEGKIPKTDNLTGLLEQGLQSQDKTMLNVRMRYLLFIYYLSFIIYLLHYLFLMQLVTKQSSTGAIIDNSWYIFPFMFFMYPSVSCLFFVLRTRVTYITYAQLIQLRFCLSWTGTSLFTLHISFDKHLFRIFCATCSLLLMSE